MLIGELSKRSGLSRDTIRFYEKKGLIQISKKDRRGNNYKEYSEATLNKLLLIIMVKELGFTLNEIEMFFHRWSEQDASCKNLMFTLENKLQQVNEQLLQLAALKQKISDSLTKCRNNECQFEKTVPSCICS